MMKLVVLLLAAILHLADAGTYSQALALHKKKLNNETYNTKVRPLLDQSNTILINVSYTPVRIIEVDNVAQTFTSNGFVSLMWYDEVIPWNPADYGNETVINPEPEDVWKPRLLLINTVTERDPFKDDFSPVFARSNGQMEWYPGGLLTTTCELDLTKYPFDQQICEIFFQPMFYFDASRLIFLAKETGMHMLYYSRNSEWDLLDTRVDTGFTSAKSHVKFVFTIKRRPTTFLYTILLPVGFLSLLNILVFTIPVQSGEKISYGITVLLAQAVFMTIMMSMLPRSSETVPRLTIYVFCLLVIAVFTVLSSILVVYLHHKDENTCDGKDGENTEKRKGDFNFKARNVGGDMQSDNKTDANFNQSLILEASKPNWQSGRLFAFKSCSWKQMSQLVDRVSFVSTVSAVVIASAVYMSIMAA